MTKTRPANASRMPSGPYQETKGDGGLAARVEPRNARSGRLMWRSARWYPRRSLSWTNGTRSGTSTSAAAITTATSPAPLRPRRTATTPSTSSTAAPSAYSQRSRPTEPAGSTASIASRARWARQPDVLGRVDPLLVERREARNGVALLDEVDRVPERADDDPRRAPPRSRARAGGAGRARRRSAAGSGGRAGPSPSFRRRARARARRAAARARPSLRRK